MTSGFKNKIHSVVSSHRLNVIALLVGILAALGATLFRGMIGGVQNLFFDGQIDFDLLNHLTRPQSIYQVFIPIFGLLISNWLIESFASEARGHGVPEVIEAVQHRSGIIRKRVALVKTLASSFTIGAGGSLGREGPIVQIGAAIGSLLGQTLKLRRREMKVLVACGASAGIAATFNTPIAGVIFSIEIILLEWRAKSFIPLVISTVFATLISRYYLGNHPAFVISEFSLKTNAEIFFYLFLGIATAFSAMAFISGIDWIEQKFKALIQNAWLRCIVGGLAIGAMGYVYPYLYGGGYEATDAILHQHIGFSILAPLLLLKIVSVGLTLASGGSGGVFAPSLLMGAMTGGLYGLLVHALFPDSTMTYGAYALVGMGSFFAAVSRGTFTSIVILFEMTRNYSIILPLMFACVVADQVALLLMGNDSIYARTLRQKNLNFSMDFGVHEHVITPIRNLMAHPLESIRSGTRVENAWKKVQLSHHTVYPVVNRQNILLGAISYLDLEIIQRKHGQKTIDEVMRGARCTVYPEDSAQNVIDKLEHTRDPRAFVIDRNTRELLGMVTPTDLIRCQNND